MRHTCTSENNSVKALASFPSSFSSRLFGHLQYRKAQTVRFIFSSLTKRDRQPGGNGLIGWQCITKVSSSEDHHAVSQETASGTQEQVLVWRHQLTKLWAWVLHHCMLGVLKLLQIIYITGCLVLPWSCNVTIFLQCSVLIAHCRWNLQDDSNRHGFEFSWQLWPHL